MDSQQETLRKGLHEAWSRQEAVGNLTRSGALQRWAAVEACRGNPALPGRATATLFTGDTLQVDLREEVSRYLFVSGIFEPELTRFLCSVLKPGMVFADIGAHFGYYSKVAARLVGPAGQVFAFEPIPATIAMLWNNTEALDQVTVIERALWSEATTLSFSWHGQPWSAFASAAGTRLPANAAPKQVEKLELPAVPYDSFFAEQPRRPQVVKIDVESAELQVLKGMDRALRQDRPVVTVEVGDFENLVAAGVPRSADMLAFLAGYDYDLFELKQSKAVPHVLRTDAYKYDNIVGVPRERAAEVGVA